MPELSQDEQSQDSLGFLWRLYFYTFRLGFTQILKGLEFYRCVENYWFLREFGDELPEKRILDIGPWKSPLPAFMASCGADVEIIDVAEGAAIQDSYARKVGLSTLTSNTMPYFEGEISFDLPGDRFDIVTCVSTIEHFENDGDLGVISEIHRILAKGGKAFLTVPYGPKYDEHRHYKWFERTYDDASIDSRLCGDGFKTCQKLYFKDENTLKFTRLYWKLPRLGRLLLGRLWVFFAAWYLKRDKATAGNASLCGVILEKE
jgi:2-polyprenyl-3-methyl-5-hydroxy-6-metoxy-1,4-benzoquinol methylase